MSQRNIYAKVKELEIVIAQSEFRPRGLRFFYADINYFFILSDKSCGSFSWIYNPYSIIDYGIKSYQQRGEILSEFAKLEVLLSELLRLKLIGLNPNDSENSELLDDILVYVSFPQKGKLLKEYGLISKELSESIYKLAKIRDVYAHRVMVGEAQLEMKKSAGGKQSIAEKQVFTEFKKLLEKTFQDLVAAFQSVLLKFDVEAYIDTIIDKISKHKSK